MLIFANTVDPHELVQLQKFIEVDGVTMNPSMIAEAALSNLGAVITDILSCLSGTVFVQVACRSTEEGVAAGSALASISPRIHVKVPCTKVGSEVIRQLTSQGVQCNGTLCFSGVQALLAAKSGATSISVFLNRLNAAGRDGTGALNSITSSVRNYLIPLKIIAASLKGRDDIETAIEAGVDAMTLSPSEWLALLEDPLSETGADQFHQDWQKIPRPTFVQVERP